MEEINVDLESARWSSGQTCRVCCLGMIVVSCDFVF